MLPTDCEYSGTLPPFPGNGTGSAPTSANAYSSNIIAASGATTTTIPGAAN